MPVRRLNTDSIIGTGQLAKRLGVTRNTISAWALGCPDFPPAICTTSHERIWYWPDIEAWLAATGRYKDRRISGL